MLPRSLCIIRRQISYFCFKGGSILYMYTSCPKNVSTTSIPNKRRVYLKYCCFELKMSVLKAMPIFIHALLTAKTNNSFYSHFFVLIRLQFSFYGALCRYVYKYTMEYVGGNVDPLFIYNNQSYEFLTS